MRSLQGDLQRSSDLVIASLLHARQRCSCSAFCIGAQWMSPFHEAKIAKNPVPLILLLQVMASCMMHLGNVTMQLLLSVPRVKVAVYELQLPKRSTSVLASIMHITAVTLQVDRLNHNANHRSMDTHICCRGVCTCSLGHQRSSPQGFLHEQQDPAL